MLLGKVTQQRRSLPRSTSLHWLWLDLFFGKQSKAIFSREVKEAENSLWLTLVSSFSGIYVLARSLSLSTCSAEMLQRVNFPLSDCKSHALSRSFANCVLGGAICSMFFSSLMTEFKKLVRCLFLWWSISAVGNSITEI